MKQVSNAIASTGDRLLIVPIGAFGSYSHGTVCACGNRDEIISEIRHRACRILHGSYSWLATAIAKTLSLGQSTPIQHEWIEIKTDAHYYIVQIWMCGNVLMEQRTSQKEVDFAGLKCSNKTNDSDVWTIDTHSVSISLGTVIDWLHSQEFSPTYHWSQHNCQHFSEELEEELGVPTADSDDNKESATVDDIKENAFRNIDGLDDNLQSNQQLDMKTDLSVNGLNDRIKRTNEIYETAKEGQKRQADEFLQIASKKQKLINLNVGDNVLVSIPEIDHGPTGPRNVLALIIELKYDKYKLGTEEGVLAGYYSFHQISKAPRAATLLVSHVTQCEPKSLREIVKLQSITGCQGLLKCSCKGRSSIQQIPAFNQQIFKTTTTTATTTTKCLQLHRKIIQQWEQKKPVDDVGFKQSARFPPYTIIFKKPQQNEQVTDCKLIEHLILEWKK
ncbi:unnamed protein product [Rotaria sp. Silwood1]|nr:unnamed protein product [Rotaria sp. Silwood1]